MRKYYFAYHYVNGQPFAFMWAEEGGMPIGGIPDVIPDTQVEISQQEFDKGILLDLEREFPFKGVPPSIPD